MNDLFFIICFQNYNIGETLCSLGHYCIQGNEIPCPVGRYGDREGLATSYCTETCVAGEFCDLGSIKPSICPKGSYCPDGMLPIACPAGVYGSTRGLKDQFCSGLCKLGHYCEKNSTSATKTPCPAGTYGSITGLEDSHCSGRCSQGYFCPEKSLNSTMHKCGSPNYYCPEGTGANPIKVTDGYYTIGGTLDTRSNQTLCEKGFFCENGIRTACIAGTFGSIEGLTSDKPMILPNFTKIAMDKIYPTARPTSHHPTYHPTGTPTSTPSAYDTPYNHSTIIPTSVPTYSPNIASIFYCNGFCLPGYWCSENSTSATQFPCNSGRYGNTSGLTNRDCTNVCPIAHYCENATVIPVKCRAGK